MEPRGVMGGIYRLTEWIMRLSVINLLWILCGAPFFYFIFVSFLTLLNGSVQEEDLLGFVQTACLTLGVLAPFTFFPSTAAMFTVARKWVTGEADVPLFKTFFKGYKDNFKQSMLGGIIYTVLIVVLIVDYYFFIGSENGRILSGIFIGLIVLALVSLLNFFSMLVHYHMKTLQLIKNSLLITIGKPLRSITAAVLVAFILFLSFTQFTWLLLFFTGSMIAAVAYWNFNLIYMKLQQQIEDMKKNEEEEVEIAAEMDREDLVKSDYKETK
ncbi:hypothetical protein J40TS1_10370 [Paenibacillus montaniterrae]|uniref:DUF624 domain-containing protein n=1 Tax=Paenibacillus montaniterrae TaxID=429341 RepID=A0A920CWM2_9BACL|nr:DUF624 domain-containing protein [Paenibacillus montaniterrae]GIP15395.1 hypothetical protein J40TS1_10370 [Paenibacillus montaniterrae]